MKLEDLPLPEHQGAHSAGFARTGRVARLARVGELTESRLRRSPEDAGHEQTQGRRDSSRNGRLSTKALGAGFVSVCASLGAMAALAPAARACSTSKC